MTSSITPPRISPGMTPDTHPSIATGHSRSTFELPAGATATDRLIEPILARGSARLRGIRMHLGSQIRYLRVFEAAVRTVAPYLRACDLTQLCVGGGHCEYVVCSLVTSAYGYSMASSYNRLGRRPSCSPPAAAPPPCFAVKPRRQMQLDVWPSRQEDS